MINLRVLVPESTTNYIQNPSWRYATTGWNAVGSAITRSLDFARFGIASGKVVTNGVSLNEGVYYRVSNLNGVSENITVSIYVRGAGEVRIRLLDNPVGQQYISDPFTLRSDRWSRIEVSGFSTGSDDLRLYVETSEPTPQAITFYIDGAQMERKPYSTSYCDGNQPGCRWNVTDSASISTRTGDTREGGKWVPLAGPCRPNNDIYVTVLGGFGEPPIANNIQPWATTPGSFYQNQKILDRVSTLTFTVKKEDLSPVGAPSLRNLHELRQQLVDLFKSDKTLNDEAFWFEYSETTADKPLYIRMRYEAGLEGSWDVRNGWFNTFALRLLAVDPLWSEDSQEVQQLGISNGWPASTGLLWQKVLGEWSSVKNSSGVSLTTGVIEVIKISPDGSIYIGGTFTTPTGTAKLCKWDGTNFTKLDLGVANGNISDLDFASDGTVYVVGNFTTIAGIAANRIAKYNPSTGVWSALGTGLNNDTKTVCVAPNNQIYVGGDFTTAGGISCLRIARWDGLQWRTVGATSGVNNTVSSICNAGDGSTLYIGGAFTASNGGGVTYNCVAQININTNLISQMGLGVSGVNSQVVTLAVGRDGTVYAGGKFTASGSIALLNVARWSGGGIWTPLGSGLSDNFGPGGTPITNPAVGKLILGKKGEIFAIGQFNISGSKVVGHQAKWFGDTWLPLESDFNAANFGNFPVSICQHPNESIYVGLNNDTNPYNHLTPKINTINNPGSASCWPKMYVLGQGTVRYISNIKTGQEIFLDLRVFSGEEVFIDFARGKIESTVRGNLNYTILPGSEIRSIFLLPGENKVAILVTDDVTATMQIEFTPQDWSADAVVDAEALS